MACKEFTERIRELRYANDEEGNPIYSSTEQFAEEIGMSRQSLGYWLNGERSPQAETLILMSKALKISVDYLLKQSEGKSLDADVQNAIRTTGLTEKSVAKINDIPDGGSGLGKLILNKIIESEHFDDAMSYLLSAYAVKGLGADKDEEGASVVGYDHKGNGGIILSTEESIHFYIGLATREFEDSLRDLLLG